MTDGEMKFALQVEMVLNRIPQPEYRQLMVEAMMVLCLIVEHDSGKTQWAESIQVDRIVHLANDIFIDEQVCGNPLCASLHILKLLCICLRIMMKVMTFCITCVKRYSTLKVLKYFILNSLLC